MFLEVMVGEVAAGASCQPPTPCTTKRRSRSDFAAVAGWRLLEIGTPVDFAQQVAYRYHLFVNLFAPIGILVVG